MTEEDRHIALEAEHIKELAELKGQMTAIQLDLKDLKERVRQPKMSVIIGSMATVAGVLLALGSFALQPVYDNLGKIGESLKDISGQVSEHVHDGHPEAVRAMVTSLRDTQEKITALVRQETDRQRDLIEFLRNRIRQMEKVDANHEVNLSTLQAIISERSRQFQISLDSKAGDRWTASEQRQYQDRIEGRLKRLEGAQGYSAQNGD